MRANQNARKLLFTDLVNTKMQMGGWDSERQCVATIERELRNLEKCQIPKTLYQIKAH